MCCNNEKKTEATLFRSHCGKCSLHKNIRRESNNMTLHLLRKIAVCESDKCRRHKNISVDKCAATKKKGSEYAFQKKLRRLKTVCHQHKNISE